MSLAELLKADLEDLEEEEDEELDSLMNHDDQTEADESKMILDEDREEEKKLTFDEKTSELYKTLNKESVRHIAKLLDSDQLKRITEQIEVYQKQNLTRFEIIGPVEQDPEYKLIVEANNLTVEIDNEIGVIHKYIRDKYSKRFPELESLVPNALDYIRTVRELGNRVGNAKNNEVLQKFLTTATIMVVSVSASTTQGSNLNEKELELIDEACDIAVRLNDTKVKIFDYVESRMTFIAPNLSVIVGASTAAKIMGKAGGLTNLSKMPACNILLLGNFIIKKTL